MIRKTLKTKGGFIALMSAIVISVVLLLLVSNLNLTGFYNRFNILDSELKEKSSALAEGCAEKALSNLMRGINFTGDVIIGGNKCTIISVATSSGRKTITTKAVYQNSYTNLKVIVDSTDFSVISWEEI